MGVALKNGGKHPEETLLVVIYFYKRDKICLRQLKFSFIFKNRFYERYIKYYKIKQFVFTITVNYTFSLKVEILHYLPV